MIITREEFVALSAELLAKITHKGLINWLYGPDERMMQHMSAESRTMAMMSYVEVQQRIREDSKLKLAYYNVVISVPNILYDWAKLKDDSGIDITKLFEGLMQYMMLCIVVGSPESDEPVEVEGLGSVYYVENEDGETRPRMRLENFDFDEVWGGMLYALPAPIGPKMIDLYLDAFRKKGWI